MKAPPWPQVIFLFLIMVSAVISNGVITLPSMRRLTETTLPTPTNSSEPTVIDVSWIDPAAGDNEHSTDNYTLHGETEDYTQHQPGLPPENSFSERLDDEVEAPPPPPPPPGCVEHLVRTFVCVDETSFSEWGTQVTELEGQRVAVRITQVNGNLTLPPNANLSLVALLLQQTNLIAFTNHTQDLSTLEELNLNGNPLFDASSLLQLGKLPSLVSLKLAGTPLSRLSNRKLMLVLKEMPALKYLDASSTQLHHLEANTFHHNTKLQELNIARNDLINLTLDQGIIEQLMHLNVSNCSMEKLHVGSKSGETIQTRLQSVDLSHNHLTSLPAYFMNIISNGLVALNISDNLWNESCTLCSHYHLWKYTDQHPDRVHGAQNQSCFRKEKALKLCGWEECPATCKCDPKTKTVNCSSADLKTVPHLAPSDAEILLLKNNNLLNLSGIESPVWCKLKTVNADGNRISSIIPPDTVGHCTCFEDDNLYEEEQNCLPQSLQKLSLCDNQIKNLSPGDCQLLYSLKKLHLSGNKVEHLGSYVCSSLGRLEVLFLDKNSYSDLEEKDVAPHPNLKKLNLSFNKLVTLPYRILELMPKLTVLNVSNNNLREFSAKTSTPDTPFTFMVPKSLENLDLSNNNLEKISSVLSLEHIPVLKSLSIYNNPWECSCKTLIGPWDQLKKNTAMVKAMEALKCQEPSKLKDSFLNEVKTIVSQNCLKPEQQKGFFPTVVAIVIIILLVLIVFRITYQKIISKIYDEFGLPASRNDITFRRRYSVFIVHSWQDNEMVKTDLVNPLQNLGYSVAWNENAFPLGDNVDASIERAVKRSRRMLVVASNNLIAFPNGMHIIQRGLTEERTVPGFKVVALVMDDLPNVLYNDLHDIVVRRTHVSRQNRNYIKAICGILPSPGASQRINTYTETDVYNFMMRYMETIQNREDQRQQPQ